MTPSSIAPKTARRTASAALATALCGSLVFSPLAAFAQTPPPAATPAPTSAPAPSATAPTEPTAVAEPPPVALPPPVEAAPPPEPPPAPPVDVAPGPPPPPPMAAPAEPPVDAPAPPVKPKLPAYLMWGVGGASLLVGSIFGIVAVSKESSFKDHPTYDKADAVHTDALVSDIGLGLGAILLVSGTVFYFVEDKDDAPAQQALHTRQRHPFARLGVSPVVGMKTQGAALTLKF